MNKSQLITGAIAGLVLAPLTGYYAGLRLAERAPVAAQIVMYDEDALLRRVQSLPESDQAAAVEAARKHITAVAAEGVIVLNRSAVRSASKDLTLQ